MVGTNSTQITTTLDNTPFVSQGFDCLTWGAVVFSTTIQSLQLEFVTRGSDDSPVPQEFTYNSAPCPGIEASVDTFSMDKDSNVQVAISGKVSDQASDLVYNPADQILSLNIAVGSFLQRTIQLSNTAQPVLPWRPYAYGASFSAVLNVQALGLGEVNERKRRETLRESVEPNKKSR